MTVIIFFTYLSNGGNMTWTTTMNIIDGLRKMATSAQ